MEDGATRFPNARCASLLHQNVCARISADKGLVREKILAGEGGNLLWNENVEVHQVFNPVAQSYFRRHRKPSFVSSKMIPSAVS